MVAHESRTDAGVRRRRRTRCQPNGLNPRNTFESFVVGANNQFAHAACLAVGERARQNLQSRSSSTAASGSAKRTSCRPSASTSPAAKKAARSLYITSERFTNEFIDAIQNSTLVKFRKRYRQADVLLIDDIQFLAGKERSQEEFFHTFNALFDGHKQIVLSSDRPPSEIANLEPRLVSRFEWGLTAELQPPDVETRVAILRKKAQRDARSSSTREILEFLAERIRTNVRRLEGALMRVASYASLNAAAIRRSRRSSTCSRTSSRRKRGAPSPSTRSRSASPSTSTCASPT